MSGVHAQSHVVPLPGLRHIRDAVDDSARLWLVNVCRTSCGFCQQLAPRWEQLARKLKHTAHVAYWDADVSRPARALGLVNSTPAIRALVPHGAESVEYDGVREPRALVRFATDLMPSRVSLIDSEASWARLNALAASRRVPHVLAFINRSHTAPTPPLLRALSVDFADRLVLSEVRLRTAGAAWVHELARRQSVRTTPTLLGVAASELLGAATSAGWSPETRQFARFERSPPTFARLETFLADAVRQHAALDQKDEV